MLYYWTWRFIIEEIKLFSCAKFELFCGLSVAEIQLTGFVVRFTNDWRLWCNFHCLAAGLAFVLPVAGQSCGAQKCMARQGAPHRGCPTEALPFQHSCSERAGCPSQGISFASVAKPFSWTAEASFMQVVFIGYCGLYGYVISSGFCLFSVVPHLVW